MPSSAFDRFALQSHSKHSYAILSPTLQGGSYITSHLRWDKRDYNTPEPTWATCM